MEQVQSPVVHYVAYKPTDSILPRFKKIGDTESERTVSCIFNETSGRVQNKSSISPKHALNLNNELRERELLVDISQAEAWDYKNPHTLEYTSSLPKRKPNEEHQTFQSFERDEDAPNPLTNGGKQNRHRPKNSCEKTKGYCRTFVSFLFSHIGLCLLVIGYCIVGAFMFRQIERDAQFHMITEHMCNLTQANRLIQLLMLEFHQKLIKNVTLSTIEWVVDQINQQPEHRVDILGKFLTSSSSNETDKLAQLESQLDNSLTAVTRDVQRQVLNYSEHLMIATYRAFEDGWKPTVERGFFTTYVLNSSESMNQTVCCGASCANFTGVQQNQDVWTLTGALLYATTVITTIGYGHIVPRTDMGRMVTVFYAMIGIPLVLLCLTNLGGFLANCVRLLYQLCLKAVQKRQARQVHTDSLSNVVEQGMVPNKNQLTVKPALESDNEKETGTRTAVRFETKISPAPPIGRHQARRSTVSAQQILHTIATSQSLVSKRTSEYKKEEIRVPIWLTLLIIFIYLTIGALIFASWENWGILQSAYFIFITLSTIGFGDFVPGIQQDQWYKDSRKPVFCCFYLLIGLSMIAMCFTLMQEEVKTKFRSFARRIGLIDAD